MPKTNVDYWSTKIDRNRSRDEEHLKSLSVLGWNTLVVWECRLSKAMDFKLVQREIMEYLSEDFAC